MIVYADDVEIVVIDEDLENMRIVAERTIKDMSLWYAGEELSLAHYKTGSIL